MVKVTFCLRRLPSLTWQQFSDYWRDVHAPMVIERAGLLGIRRYTQVRTIQDDAFHAMLQRRNGGSTPPFDGIAETWFDSIDVLRGPASEVQGRAWQELRADEANFIDLPNSPAWAGEDQLIVTM